MFVHFLLLLTLTVLLSHAQQEYGRQLCSGDASTVNCRKNSELSELINALKHENVALRATLNDNNCTVCWSDPCFNGGTCNPLSVTAYRCDCLDDYGGSQCQTHVQCLPNSCGANADCFVANHQINCVCKAGFSGDPVVGCALKTVQSCMSGDPHYVTFDGQHFDYQGTCPYIFVKPCNSSFPVPYEYFEVKARNEKIGAHVSAVVAVEVLLYGQVLHIDKLNNFYFNRVKKSIPFYYPNNQNRKISVLSSSGVVQIKSDQYVVIEFTYGRLCVTLPDVPEFRGERTLCGVGGNIDGDCKDDFINSDGSAYTNVTSCINSILLFTELFGDTFITNDFLNFQPGVCLTGEEVFDSTINCDLLASKAQCQPIRDAVNGTGYFGACSGLGELVIESLYEDCGIDTCLVPDSLCGSFANFAQTCQINIPNTPLSYRSSLGCPELHCGLHSLPSPCAPGCPVTCANPVPVPVCSQPCIEGCKCDNGYFLDEGDPQNIRCVELQDCGCTDNDGNYHQGNEQWLTENCTKLNYCSNGTFYSVYKPCSADAACQLNQNHEYQCICNNGFGGDGYICGDIDECADLNTCSAGLGQGACTNTLGSYYCTCNVYYNDGDNCENYLPLRHCADLYVYHNKTVDGVYSIKPPYSVRGQPAFSSVDVYCAMSLDGGGWTLLGNSLFDSMSNKTFAEYEEGFGDPAIQDLWLGLKFISEMTNQVVTSLRLELYRCPTGRKAEMFTDCTYDEFKILDSSTGYAAVVPYDCVGTENTAQDGWVRWVTDVGPSFAAFDSVDGHCSSEYRNTGWWFDSSDILACGPANLNGVRVPCSDPNTGDTLRWNGNTIGRVQLYLRPFKYPNNEPDPTPTSP